MRPANETQLECLIQPRAGRKLGRLQTLPTVEPMENGAIADSPPCLENDFCAVAVNPASFVNLKSTHLPLTYIILAQLLYVVN
jgi:hypothetical protein